MRFSTVFPVLILGKAVVLFALAPALLSQEPAIHYLSLPDELREIPLNKSSIFEDINQDGRLDLLFIEKNDIFLSYQSPEGSFSAFETIPVPLAGAVDFADVFPGGEKEICLMHGQGISCFQKKDGRWEMTPVPLAIMLTVYEGPAVISLTREHFALDLDGDGVPELILWGRQALCFYRKDNSGRYQIHQTIPLETRTYLKFPGMKVFNNPLAWLLGENARSLYQKEWPLPVRYLNWTQESISCDFLIGDVNHDSQMEFAWIRKKELKDLGKGVSTVYEYEIHILNKDKKFASEPQRIIRDPHGVWLSSMCTDIKEDGSLDLLRYQIKSEGSLLQRPRIQFELFLETESGDYSLAPTQTIETSDYPLGADPLVDVNGDGFKDLVLVHPDAKGFSLGGIIRKYVEKSLDMEVRVLPFRQGRGFSREGMITKKVSVSFVAGFPISLAGDFNGDGLKDIVVMESDRLKIYPFLREQSSFLRLPWVDVRIPHNRMYEVIDLDGDQKSEIVLYYPDRIGILRINQLPK
jgi:hypothetical protein